MTLFPSATPTTIDAVRLLSAVADVFSGHALGFGMHVASVTARFTAFRDEDPEAIAAAYYAAALHRIGAVSVVVPRDATERDAQLSSWDEPTAGAAIVSALRVFPTSTADAIRWHREAFDGTGYPDRLRWNGIPQAAMALNVSRAFVEALEAQAGHGGSAADAVFTLVEGSGTIFALTAMRAFRAFLAACSDTFDAPFEPEWPLPDASAPMLVTAICNSIDARQSRTAGRGDRLERIVRAIVAQLGDARLDPDVAALAARCTALARTGRDGSSDDVFGLTRLGLELRAAQAQRAAGVLRAAPGFAPFAAIVADTEEWYDGSGLPAGRTGSAIDPLARVIAVATAAEAVVAADAPARIAAAAATRLDPEVVAAYLATLASR